MPSAFLTDSHAHWYDSGFDADREQMIERALAAGVGRVINIGCDLASSELVCKLADEYEFVYAAVGLHPDGLGCIDILGLPTDTPAPEISRFLAGKSEAEMQDFILSCTDSAVIERCLRPIRALADQKKVVAIGEIGLDYHWNTYPQTVQQEYFRQQLLLAKECDLPVIIHNRDAHQDLLRIVIEEGLGHAGGVMHCYSGSWEMAKKYLDLGFYISFAGPVTFTNARKLAEVARNVPPERMLIETDCPYLAPHPNRGKRNESAYVRLVAEKLAELKKMTLSEVAVQTTENAAALFRIH